MKQIISKCFSKMKRVALTLFAAFCVGSVWAEEGEVTTPEVTPDSEPTPSASPLTIDSSAGYIVTGLGELHDQVAVVFTNHAAVATWRAPKDLKNIEILVVGGGGGGGGHYFKGTSNNNKKLNQGGAGGGGGAVVTGFIKDLAANQVVNVTVGAGGTNGLYTTSTVTGSGSGGNGGNSILKVGDLTYVTAYGGGGDGGYNSTGVANGGSNSGARKNLAAADLVSVNAVGEGAENLVSDVVSRAHKGGSGYYAGSSGYPAAGGGGAGGEGGSTGDSSSSAADGGAGYESFITDVGVIYGAGGAGGYGKSGTAGSGTKRLGGGREDSGAGHSDFNKNGTDAVANRGGGGGGGSYQKAGGDGGSGVVILRFGYSETDILVDATVNVLPKISDKKYTGETLTSGLVDTYAYTVQELGDCLTASGGSQTVRVTLNEGYVWSDGSTDPKEFEWNVLKEDNNQWVTAPSLELNSWPQSYAENVVFVPAVPMRGGLVATIEDMNGSSSFNGTLPTEPGTYTIKYEVVETNDYSPLYWEKTFTIYRSEDFEGGYKVFGLGENGNEVAMVFTGVTEEPITWTVPYNYTNAQFLVVGGGGGGGAENGGDDQRQAGAGGGGGGDGGAAKNEKAGAIGKTGGSSGGSRPGCTTLGSITPARTNSVALASAESFGNKGGKGYGTASYYGLYAAAGGGGGAIEPGYDATGTSKAGNGGQGLLSDIMGAPLVYGSGGGGATVDGANGGLGGNGAGDGNTAARNTNSGANASPYQGGGGGGASREGNGGAGGSGIVVLRYEQLVDVDELNLRLADRVYNGEAQIIEDSVAYTVTGETTGIEFGEYHVVITPKEGYLWPNTKTNEGREYTWSITQATNEWTQDCAVSILTWTKWLDEPGMVTPALAKYGNVIAKIKKEGEENEVDFVSFPNEAGTYTVTYYPETTASFNSDEMSTQSFTVVILSPEEIPDYTVTTGEVTASLDRKVTIPYNVACSASTGYKTTLYVEYVTEGVETKTNTYDAVALSKPGSTGNLVVDDLKPGATYTVKVFAQVNDQGQVGEIVELEPVQIAIPGAATGLAANATFTDESFTISGKINPAYTPGADDYTVVTVYWSLNGNAFDNSQEFRFKDTQDGNFSVTQAYDAVTDKLYWKVEVSNTITTDTWSGQTFDSSNSDGLNIDQQVKERKDSASITYTWTGNGEDGLWANRANWSWAATDPNAVAVEAYGYPGTEAEGGYQSKVVFDADAEVDLEGAVRYIQGAVQMAEGISVEIRNGTLGFQTDPLILGAAGSTLTFKNVGLPYGPNGTTTKYFVNPAADSTVVIDGNNDVYGHLKYSPTTAGNFVIKNFEGRTYIAAESAVDGSVVEINNAKWDLRTGETNNRNTGNKYVADKGLPKKIVFQDGEEERATLRSLWYNTGNKDDEYAMINLNGRTFDIVLPTTISSNHRPNIVARLLSANANCTINVDATKYADGQPVKLIQIVSGLGDKKLEYTLNVTANGEDVKEARNARLEWIDNHLCYIQDTYNEAVISRSASNEWGDKWIEQIEFSSWADAIAAAQSGEVVKLLCDIETSAAIVVTKAVTIDLNGKTIKANDTDAETDGNGVFWVKQDGVLTIEGEGTVDGNGGNGYKMAVWADGGRVVINGGTYVNLNEGTHPQYDLIYAKNGGVVEINGGTFMCQTTRWTLNSNNKSPGTFVVKGGKFLGYDPSKFNTDEADVTNWCADGYFVVAVADGYNLVVPASSKSLIGEVAFATFDDALAAAESGNIIKLLDDVVITTQLAVPAGVVLDLNNSTISLGDLAATLSVGAEFEANTVISSVEGYKAIYENGAYKLVEATVTVAPGGAAVVVATEADADAVEIAVEVPAGVDITLKAYKAYFTKSVTQNSEGKYEVTAVLDDTKVKPVIAETTADDTTKEAFVIDADGNVTLNINNKMPGLYYGVQVLKELGADPVAVVPETEAGTLVVTADNIPDGNAAFFRVVVDFEPIPEAK